jgi:hypothetical protein
MPEEDERNETVLTIHDSGAVLDVAEDGEPVLAFHYTGVPKPYIHPLHLPGGGVVTNALPHDHLHHRGLWLTWPKVNGINFWEEHFAPEQTGDIRHRSFEVCAADATGARFTSRQEWVTRSGQCLLDGRFALTVSSVQGGERLLDIQVALRPVAGPVELGTPPQYHGLGYRCARSMDRGRILNANGDEGPDATKGVGAAWCSYSGRLDGIERADLAVSGDGWASVTMFDHPENPRHPTPWFTMNQPFGFIAPALSYATPYVIPAGERLVLRYGLLVQHGLARSEQLDAHHRAWMTASA